MAFKILRGRVIQAHPHHLGLLAILLILERRETKPECIVLAQSGTLGKFRCSARLARPLLRTITTTKMVYDVTYFNSNFKYKAKCVNHASIPWMCEMAQP